MIKNTALSKAKQLGEKLHEDVSIAPGWLNSKNDQSLALRKSAANLVQAISANQSRESLIIIHQELYQSIRAAALTGLISDVDLAVYDKMLDDIQSELERN